MKSVAITKVNMTEGPLLGKIIRFTMPVMASGVLQFLYNAADTAVVGRFVGKPALAAVGSTGQLSLLITGLFIGMSVGTNVSVSHALGSGEEKNVKDIVQTSVLLSFILGLAMTVLGLFTARPLLLLMSVPDSVIDLSVVYMETVFFGMTAQMAYNYGAAVLNARGDTRHPFYFLLISGLLNVGLNFFFVLACDMGVFGVALATVISQYLSAFLVLRQLTLLEENSRLDILHLYIKKERLKKIIRIGIPAGVQGVLFSLSNVLIQSSINSFGETTMAANTAGSNVDGLIYIAMNSFYHAALAFAGQNAGAGDYRRVKKVCGSCMFLVSAFGIAIGALCYLFGPQLLSIFAPGDDEVIKIGMTRLLILGLPYFLCGTMEVMSGMLRGIGASTVSMTVSLLGACVFRIIWIYTVFVQFHTLDVLYLSFPVSWLLTTCAHFVCFCFIMHRRENPKTEVCSGSYL